MRTALIMSAITGNPVRCTGIKDDHAKPRPGLGPAGRTQFVAVSQITGGDCEAPAGAHEADLTPRRPQEGAYQFDVAHEESMCAPLTTVLETLILPLSGCRGNSSVLLRGATHMMGAMTSDELARVYIPMLGNLGLHLQFTEIIPGFFPQGHGEAELLVAPAGPLNPMKAEHSFQPKKIGVDVVIAGLPVHLAEQALEGVTDRLGLFGLKPETSLRRARGSTGMSVLVWADSGRARAGFTSLGKPGGRPESLATEAAEAMLTFLGSGAGVPAEMAAVILPVLACGRGTSHISVDRLSQELRAAARVIDVFWPDTVRIDSPSFGGPSQVRVLGRDWGHLMG